MATPHTLAIINQHANAIGERYGGKIAYESVRAVAEIARLSTHVSVGHGADEADLYTRMMSRFVLDFADSDPDLPNK